MQQNSLPRYEDIIARLNQDLDVLEHHSTNLQGVQDYTESVQQSAKRLFDGISDLQVRFQQTQVQFNTIAQVTDSNLRELILQLSTQVESFDKLQLEKQFEQINHRLAAIESTLAQKLTVVETRVNDVNRSLNLMQGEFNSTLKNFGEHFAKGIKDSEKRLRNAQEGMGESLYREISGMNSKLIFANVWGVLSVLLLLVFLLFLR